ncbi:MAG: hypothetical protein ACREMO_11835, partial [Gemmatimonadales bacterium]
ALQMSKAGAGAAPPTAKPPSGVNMATKTPTSAPKPMSAPKMGGMGGMGKEEMPASPSASSGGTLSGADGAAGGLGKAGLPTSSMAGQMKGGGATGLTSPNDTSRADTHAAALGGAFQPKGPISSGLELDTKPPKAGGGLASPAAAGLAPKKPGKPGIFGRLQGK